MSGRAIRRAAAGLAIALGVVVAPATANEGSLYPTGPGVSGPYPQFTESRNGVYYTVNAPELRPAHAGPKWEMTWGCPLPGTEIARIEWSGARTAPGSSLEVRVAADGADIWRLPDGAIPPVSQGGQYYALDLRPGTCTTQLRLWQTEGINQHARGYVINDPKVFVRDISAPTVRMGELPSGWLSAGHAPLPVRWSASDNFGADGMGLQEVVIGGVRRWAGAVGPGDHGVTFGLGDVPDGVHNVTVRAHGDGTPSGEAAGTIYLDRTPPTVSSTAASVTARPGVAALAWVVDDSVSGTAGTSVDLNTAADGSVVGTWRELASSPTGSGGGEVDVRSLGEGVHAWRIRAADLAGNARTVAASGTVAVDLTPPSLELSGPSGWVRRASVGVDQSDNLQSVLGLGATEIAINSATDGSASGNWTPLLSTQLGPGRHNPSVDLSTVASGRHAMRVRVRNGGALGQALVTERSVPVLVDTTSPAVSSVAFAPAGAGRVRASWRVEDAHSGVASATVQWWNGSAWRDVGAKKAEAGADTLTVDISALPKPASRFRVLVTDAVGNVGESAGDIGTDGGAPVVSDLRLQGGPPWVLTWQQGMAEGAGACETVVEVSGPAADDGWREVLSGRRSAGPQRAVLPLDGLEPGGYRVRVVTCDSTGGTASATTGGLQVGGATRGEGAGSGAPDPYARLRGARITARLSGARAHRRGGRRVEVSTIAHGSTVTVTGRLRAAGGAPLAQAEIQVRGHRGRVVGTGRTAADGGFRVTARPDAGGRLLVGVPAGRRLLGASAGTLLEVRVRPRVRLTASSSRVRAGAPVTFAGRVDPAPRRIGVSRKSVVLEWRDPLRGVWRPVLITPLRRDGTFRARWRFNLRGLTVPMRVRVPMEGGWPLLPATSRVVSISVRD